MENSKSLPEVTDNTLSLNSIEKTMEKAMEENVSVSSGPPKRSLFQWFYSPSKEESAESERILLQKYGNIDILNDTEHVKSNLVYLDPPESPSLSENEEGYMNTLIIDRDSLSVCGSHRKNVVICHGFGAGLGFFFRNLDPISRGIPNSRIYAVDLLGMGRSGRPPFPKFQQNITQNTNEAIDFFLDSFEKWRKRQDGLDKFTLVGHSMGGYLAALYALRHPDKVEKLILASPVGLPRQTEEDVAVTGHKIPRLITHLWNSNYTPQGFIRGLGPLGHRFAYGYINKRFDRLSEDLRNTLGRYFYHISAYPGSGEYALAALLAPGAWAREPLHTHLPSLTMPTLFIYGEKDWMDKSHAEEAAKLMTVPVRVESVPDADHHLHVDNSDQFNKLIIDQVNS